MLCSWLFGGEFLGFCEQSIARAMGCFIACFRGRDPQPAPAPLVSKEPVAGSVRQNQLSSLLLFEAEAEDCSPFKGEKYHVAGSQLADFDVRELKVEAKFLKACGTLPQTPAEIRKAFGKLKDSAPHDDDSDISKFHSWLPNADIRNLNSIEQPDQSVTPIKLREELIDESSFSAYSPSSCITGQNAPQNASRSYTSTSEGITVSSNHSPMNVHDSLTQKSEPSTVSPMPLVASLQGKTVRFDCQSDAFSFLSSSSSENNEASKQLGPARDCSVSTPSPYPTPLKLTSDMQTPGTAFPAYMHTMEPGKNPRIRSQYVYSVLNPVENSSQLKALTEEEYNSDQLTECNLGTDKEISTSETEVRCSADQELNVETSLSTWLKQKPTYQGGANQRLTTASLRHADFGKTPGDRPIIGMVAAHWNENEVSHISPKWWDGNGIPNSTNKYKEDQKVSWHATPFEERLEKALSEDSFISGRKHLGETPPLHFDENEECDTAVSQLQPSSTHLKSVVSC